MQVSILKRAYLKFVSREDFAEQRRAVSLQRARPRGDDMTQRAFSIIGDSVSTFEGLVALGNRVYYEGAALEATGVLVAEDTWWMRAMAKLGGRFLANASYSASLVEGAGFPAGSSPERAAQILGPNGEAPDVVWVFMGINDYGWGGARQQAEGHGVAAPTCLDLSAVPEREAALAPADALEGFARAYGQLLENVRRCAPAADVWCLTLLPSRSRELDHPSFCYRLRGVHLDEYNDAIRAAATQHGCKVVDTRAYGFEYESVDGTHPTKRGMEQIADLVIAAMAAAGDEAAQRACASSGADAGALPSYPEHLRAHDWCDRASCIGCTWARSTGCQWACVCEAPSSVFGNRS